MSAEIPKACQSCPKVFKTLEVIKTLERQEDLLFQGALSSTTEEMAAVVTELRSSGADISVVGDDGQAQETITDEGAAALRRLFDAQLETIRMVVNGHEEAMVEGLRDCIGARALRAVDDVGAYEISFCRSPQLSHNENRDNGIPREQGVEGIFVRRLTDEQPGTE